MSNASGSGGHAGNCAVLSSPGWVILGDLGKVIEEFSVGVLWESHWLGPGPLTFTLTWRCHMRRWIGPVVLVLAFIVPLALPATAHADLSACGNINVTADEQCKLVTSGGCTAQCTPINFQAACSAQLEVSCEGQCTAQASASCTGACDLSGCEASCSADPGNFSCSADCETNMDAQCQAQCSSSSDQAQCVASCKATISAQCDASCSGTPPSASCQAQCQASCSGSCTAQANLDCQVNCQSSGFASCQTSLTGGCQAQCSQPKGALFCNGQYVDAGNNLQNCLNALSNLGISVQGSASCSGNTCQAQGSVSCAVTPGTPAGNAAAGLGILLGIGGLFIGRRRRLLRRRAQK